MRIPFFATHAIQIRYTGTSTVKTIVIDADGGTGSDALLTLTDDDGANAFDCGSASYNTLDELVTGINALTDTGWEARRYRAYELAPIGNVDISDNSFEDLATEGVPTFWRKYLEFSDATIDVAAGATETPERALPVPVEDWGYALAHCNVVLDKAGTDAITLEFQSAAPTHQDAKGEDEKEDLRQLAELEDTDWSTDNYLGEMAVTPAGATAVRWAFQLNFSGYSFVKLGKIANAGSASETATVGGTLSNSPHTLN